MPDPGNPVTGDSVVVVQKTAGDPIQHEGVIVNCNDTAVAVQFREPLHWDTGTSVMVVRDAGSHRVVAVARPVLSRERVSAFRLLSEWSAVNLRAARRYQTDLRAEVRSSLGGPKQQATIIDVSAGGMAVEVPRKPGGGEVDVTVQVGGFSASLPCEVVDSRGEATCTLLHLRFKDLTALQQVFVRNLINSLEAGEHARRAG